MKFTYLQRMLLAIPLLAGTLSAQAEPLDGVVINGNTYTLNTETQIVLLKHANGAAVNFVFPEEVTNEGITYSVDGMAVCAFQNCQNLESVVIPDWITSIPDQAFDGCSKLTSVTIPESVTSIGLCAFSNCVSLTQIDLPAELTTLGPGVFRGCTSLTSIDIPGTVSTIEQLTFSGCTSLQSVTFPESLTAIGANAFQNCNNITELNFTGTGLNALASDAFNGVDLSNVNVTVPEGTESNYGLLSDAGASLPETEPEVPVFTVVTTDPTEADNKAVYVLTAPRGGLYAEPSENKVGSFGYADGYADRGSMVMDATDVNQQFSFIMHEGKRYLYSVGAKKIASAPTSEFTGHVTLTSTSTDVREVTFDCDNTTGTKMIKFGVYVINITTWNHFRGVNVAKNSSRDVGNSFSFNKINGVTLSDNELVGAINIIDPLTAISALPTEEENGTLYLIKAPRRGGLYAEPEANKVGGYGHPQGYAERGDMNTNRDDVNQQFAIITYNGQYYLYSLAMQSLLGTQSQPNYAELVKASNAQPITIEANGTGTWLIKYGSDPINTTDWVGHNYHGVNIHSSNADDGNRFAIYRLENVSLTEEQLNAALDVIDPDRNAVAYTLVDYADQTIATAKSHDFDVATAWPYAVATEQEGVYKLNEGEEIRFYNNRAQKFAYSDGSALQLKAESDETTLFTMISANEDGGVYIYSNGAKKFVDAVSGNTCPLNDFTSAPAVYYTGRLLTLKNIQNPGSREAFMSYVGLSKTWTDNTFWNQFGGDDAIVVGGTGANDLGSFWYLVSDETVWRANMSQLSTLNQRLTQALTGDLPTLETREPDMYEVFHDLLSTELNKFSIGRDAVSSGNLPQHLESARLRLSYYLTATNPQFINALYVGDKDSNLILGSDTDGNLYTTEMGAKLSSSFVWAMTILDGKRYLINRYHQKFLSPYREANGKLAWHLSDVPTEITLNTEVFADQTIENMSNSSSAQAYNVCYAIYAGSDSEYALSVSALPLVADSADYTPGDGDIIRFYTAGGNGNAATYTTLAEQGLEAAEESYDNALTALDHGTNPDVVGHYADNSELVEALGSVADTDSPAKRHYFANKGLNSLENNRVQLTDGENYSIVDTDGNHYLAAEGAKNVWNAEGNSTEGTWMFSHTIDSTTMLLEINGNNQFKVNFTETPGEVELTPVVSTFGLNALAEDATRYVLTHSNDEAVSTAICEIEASAREDGGKWFDLQGRCVVAPAKGIYISNGRKIYVK